MSASAEHAATVMQATLANIPTNDLIAELATREGVAYYVVNGEEEYLITTTTIEDRTKNVRRLESFTGRTRILTVVD